MSENPCDECIIKMCCEKMCDPALKYYKSGVRTRSKDEVIKATGYMWEYENNGELVMLYDMSPKQKERYDEACQSPYINTPKPVEKEELSFDKFINLIKKGLNSWLKDKN